MREYGRDPLMFFQFYDRLIQLLVKTAHPKFLCKKELAQSFSSDLRGFLDGWTAHRSFSRGSPRQAHNGI